MLVIDLASPINDARQISHCLRRQAWACVVSICDCLVSGRQTRPATWLREMQVVGFFVVEDRVQRSAAALAGPGGRGAGWEWAAAALKMPLDAAFEALQASEPLLALKDYVALACTTLGVPHARLAGVIGGGITWHHVTRLPRVVMLATHTG